MYLYLHYLDKPENFQFAASEVEICLDEVINFTCSADGNPSVHTYQLFENDTLVTDGTNSQGMWNRTMSTGGVFIYKCLANNNAGTRNSESVIVTVNGEQDNCYMFCDKCPGRVPHLDSSNSPCNYSSLPRMDITSSISNIDHLI